ncbi:hypothetical protein [Verminephrobacter aporrectodeae]|uniref:hypothetical protein n=1 Tax=Verminephrobacter aporrectodeae TaxID=1110389 RepID=UPI001110F863|nr:hypothetical protein [Verminephrobacter aporrectodeae]
MTDRTDSDSEREIRIFKELASVAKLILVPNTVRHPVPPAPDIECQVQGAGLLAVELVALDSENTHTRLANMHATLDCWKDAIKTWGPTEQERLRCSCENAHLSISICNDAGKRDRTRIMKSIQEQLLKKPDNFIGELDLESSSDKCKTSVTVFRGDDIVCGPRIFAPSGYEWQMPQICKIKQKLVDKTYKTSDPMDLFAYSIHDDVDSHIKSMAMIDRCVKRYLARSQFRRVLVFNSRPTRLQRTYSREVTDD